MKEFKYSYVGTITEREKIDNSKKAEEINESPCEWDDFPLFGEKSNEAINLNNIDRVVSFNHCGYTYKNKKQIFFCKCGKSKEEGEIIGEFYKDEIKCDYCNSIIPKSEIIYLNSNLYTNIFKAKYHLFNDDKWIKLVLFEDFIGINLSKKKLFTTKRRSSIVYNKETKRFFSTLPFSKNNKINSISLKYISIDINRCFSRKIDLNERICHIGNNSLPIFRDFKRDYINPINEFCDSLINLIEEKDRDRIYSFLTHLDFEKLETEHKDPKKTVVNNENKSYNYSWTIDSYNKERKIINDNICSNLSIIISIIQYPYLSNILFKKGKEFYFDFISLYTPPVKFLKREGETSPKDIISSCYTSYILYDRDYQNASMKELIKSKRFYESKTEEDSVEEFDKSINLIKTNLQESKKILKISRNLSIPDSLYKNDNFEPKHYFAYINAIIYSDLSKENILELIKKFGQKRFFETLHNFMYFSYENYSRVGNRNFEREIYKKIHHCLKIYKEGENNFTIYKDAYKMASEREYDLNSFYKIKTPEKIKELHDELVVIVNLERLEKFNSGIKEFSKKYTSIKSSIIDDVEFNLIDNIKSLENESKVMQHCVKSYANGMSKGYHLIFSIKDTLTGDRATLEFHNKFRDSENKDEWIFNQLKAKFNAKSTEKIRNAFFKFCETVLKKNNIKYSVNDKSYDLQIKSEGISTNPLFIHDPYLNQQYNALIIGEDENTPF